MHANRQYQESNFNKKMQENVLLINMRVTNIVLVKQVPTQFKYFILTIMRFSKVHNIIVEHQYSIPKEVLLTILLFCWSLGHYLILKGILEDFKREQMARCSDNLWQLLRRWGISTFVLYLWSVQREESFNSNLQE